MVILSEAKDLIFYCELRTVNCKLIQLLFIRRCVMKIFDWRKRSQETQETIRIQAVKLIVEAGEETKDVIRLA